MVFIERGVLLLKAGSYGVVPHTQLPASHDLLVQYQHCIIELECFGMV